MKTDMTEAGVTTSIAQTICAKPRQPFKLLQNLQQCQNFVKSKMALSSSALKTITNRPKKIDSNNTQLKDSSIQSTRSRTSSISSRQKNILNTKTTPKSNGVASTKRNGPTDSKTKRSSPVNDGNANAVGSLTSSPKWSHIKNKFENSVSVEKTKLERTSSLSNEKEVSTVKPNTSKSLNSLLPDSALDTTKVKNNETKFISKASAGATSTVTKTNDKFKSNYSTAKTLNVKDKTKSRCSSPKNSLNSIPVANASSLHSNRTPRLNTNSVVKTSSLHPSNLSKSFQSRNSLTNSSVSLSSNSSKNSEIDVASVKKTEFSSNSSLKQTKVDSKSNGANESISIKSSSSSATNSANKFKLPTTISSNATSTLLSKTSVTTYKPSLYRIKQKHEDKPIPNFNQLGESDSIAKSLRNRQVRKSLICEENKNSCTTNVSTENNLKTQPSTKQSSLQIKMSDDSKQTDEIENLKELVKSSQSSSKTIWVKDNAGNWKKKTDSGNTISQSKVANLRSRFLESNRETCAPLTKSVTTSSVPSKTSEFSRPLAKSSTTSSICDKTYIGDIVNDCSKPPQTNIVNNDIRSSDPSKEAKVPSNPRNSVDGDNSLNIVQRAILSFEGNLALLSPESQRRLKLVNEKVQAQTDDNKILKARKSGNFNTTILNGSKPKSAEKPNNAKIVGEPLLPTRSFLTRYQGINRQLSKEPKSAIKSYNSAKIENGQTLKPSTNNVASSSQIVFPNRSSSNVNDKETKEQKPIANSPESVDSATKNTTNQTLLNQNNTKDVTAKSDLQPNASFLWCRSRATSSNLSKSSTSSSVSLSSSDYRNYYDIQNYYSTLDLEIEKGSDISEEPLYIDSQESTSSDNNYASTASFSYQNIPPSGHAKNKKMDYNREWTDASDDEFIDNQTSTLKRRKNKRHLCQKESQQNGQKGNDQRRRVSESISFTDSNDTLINDEIGNESTYDLADSNHFYEPVYESLGNYLRDPDDQDENCSISLSPDDRDEADFMQCSITSLESAESSRPDKEEESEAKVQNQKKGGNKISQIKRHLSWTKNDIRLELSSKSNKIKIKKNGQTSTEIGVKVQQESGSVNTSPKKKTFIKCILRQKSASSIPIKRSPSPKKESALFYVHLTMGREKQRPFSDSVVADECSRNLDQGTLRARKQSEPSIIQNLSTKEGLPQRPRFRKVAYGPRIQRPKTPPPLPPNVQNQSKSLESILSLNEKDSSPIDFIDTDSQINSPFYTCLDPQFFQNETQAKADYYENGRHSSTSLSNGIMTNGSVATNEVDSGFNFTPPNSRKKFNLKFSECNKYPSELLKSPFEEEPMYQFYQRDVQQRATLGYSADVSESEFEDDASSKFSDSEYQNPSSRPVLQSQLSAMDLVHGEGGQRTLWCEVPEVVESGILKTISSNDRKIQEAMFEVITSEASYLKSLNFLIEHFVQCPEFSGTQSNILDKRERHLLFSDIQPVKEVSARLLGDLEKRWLENIVLSNICDIVYHHASNYFSVYVKYCSNQLYQDRTLKELKEKKSEFVTVLKRLESNSVCQGLDMHSFLMLPMQRITRLPLLIDAIFHRLSPESLIYDSCKMALATVNKLVAECNEGARKMERMEEMLVISQQLDLKDCKGFGLLSASRWLVKKGELVQLMLDNSARRTFGRSTRWCKIQLYLFLFTDLLVVTRKKSDENYSVVDYCPRNMLEVLNMDENMPPLAMRLPSSYRNIFRLTLLHNKDGKESEMFLSCLLESDRTRWMDALTPTKSENPDEKIYEKWECKQVQCIHAYNAQQPDELSLEEADVVNVFRKITGWFEGERIRDGVQGWFPCSHVREIVNSHVIARNLRQRYRLLMLSRLYLEEQYKAQSKK